MKFDRVGVFPYSPEPGTPAAAMDNQVPHDIAEERAAKIMTYCRGAMKRANKKLIGQVVDVIVDSVGDGYAVARGNSDAPDIDNVIFVEGISAKTVPGQRLTVEIADTDKSDLVAVVKKGKKKK